MTEGTVFSKLDLKWGYYPTEQEPDSTQLTMLVTHKPGCGETDVQTDVQDLMCTLDLQSYESYDWTGPIRHSHSAQHS